MTDRLASLYTPLEQAVALLHERRAAAPPPRNALEARLSSGAYAVIARHIATPNFELERFVSIASSLGLVPLVLEFHADRFVTCNSLKCALARLRFSGGPECADDTRLSTLTVADMASSDGIALRDVSTLWQQPLIAFHHELLFSRRELRCVELFDGSEWFYTHGQKASHYYTAFLSLFVEHAILFDDFLLTSSEQQFTSEVVIPSFEAAYSIHERQPLICRIDPTDAAQHQSWFHYAQDFAPIVRRRLSSLGRHSAGDAVAVRGCDLGLGVFASQHFSSGQRILRLSGRPVTFEEAHADHSTSFNMLQIAPRLYLDGRAKFFL